MDVTKPSGTNELKAGAFKLAAPAFVLVVVVLVVLLIGGAGTT